MTSFAEFSVRRPLGVVLAIAAISVFGVFAIGQLPLLFLPAIESPSLTVIAPFSNSSPEEVERRVAAPLEGAIGGMSGIESVSSTSSASSARIRAQFTLGTDMDLAAAEIRDRVDRIRGDLPDGVGRVRVSNFSHHRHPDPAAQRKPGRLACGTGTPRRGSDRTPVVASGRRRRRGCTRSAAGTGDDRRRSAGDGIAGSIGRRSDPRPARQQRGPCRRLPDRWRTALLRALGGLVHQPRGDSLVTDRRRRRCADRRRRGWSAAVSATRRACSGSTWRRRPPCGYTKAPTPTW